MPTLKHGLEFLPVHTETLLAPLGTVQGRRGHQIVLGAGHWRVSAALAVGAGVRLRRQVARLALRGHGASGARAAAAPARAVLARRAPALARAPAAAVTAGSPAHPRLGRRPRPTAPAAPRPASPPAAPAPSAERSPRLRPPPAPPPRALIGRASPRGATGGSDRPAPSHTHHVHTPRGPARKACPSRGPSGSRTPSPSSSPALPECPQAPSSLTATFLCFPTESIPLRTHRFLYPPARPSSSSKFPRARQAYKLT